MIENKYSDKCSPKEKANEILAACLERVEHWIDTHPEDIEKMTDRELDLLNDQLVKQSKRLFKILGIAEMVNHEGEVEEL